VDYRWSEKTGLARFAYRKKRDPAERLVIELQQPAHHSHAGWSHRPDVSREAMLARHFEVIRDTMRLAAAGAYR
jgi:hypothetical protein